MVPASSGHAGRCASTTAKPGMVAPVRPPDQSPERAFGHAPGTRASGPPPDNPSAAHRQAHPTCAPGLAGTLAAYSSICRAVLALPTSSHDDDHDARSGASSCGCQPGRPRAEHDHPRGHLPSRSRDPSCSSCRSSSSKMPAPVSCSRSIGGAAARFGDSVFLGCSSPRSRVGSWRFIRSSGDCRVRSFARGPGRRGQTTTLVTLSAKWHPSGQGAGRAPTGLVQHRASGLSARAPKVLGVRAHPGWPVPRPGRPDQRQDVVHDIAADSTMRPRPTRTCGGAPRPDVGHGRRRHLQDGVPRDEPPARPSRSG